MDVMTQLMEWVGPTLDVTAIVLLATVLWRLGRDPGVAWGERATRLEAIFDDLRTLVAQSEGLARDLDEKLARREERLSALLAEARAVASERAAVAAPARPDRVEVRGDTPPVTADGATVRRSEPVETARQIETLADAGTAVEEIARRLGVAAAEVRLVIGLKAARAERRRAVASEARAHG